MIINPLPGDLVRKKSHCLKNTHMKRHIPHLIKMFSKTWTMVLTDMNRQTDRQTILSPHKFHLVEALLNVAKTCCSVIYRK